MGDGLLHDTGALHDLGQEHLAGAKEVADLVHSGHQRPFDDLDRVGSGQPSLLRVLDDVGVDPFHEGMQEPVGDRPLAPGQVCHGPSGTPGRVSTGYLQQALGCVGPAVQNDVLDAFQQLGGDLRVHCELAGIHDAHVHARGDGVVEEYGVDRLADRVVAAEGERDVADAARDVDPRQLGLDAPDCLDVGDRVAGMLLDAGADGEDVRVENDLIRRQPDLLGQQAVGAPADLDLALDRVGLTLLVEGHDDDRGAVAAGQPCLAQELNLALFERDRVNDRRPADAAQPGLDDRPLRGVDDYRHPGDCRLRSHQVEEARHGRFRVQHGLVHVYVDRLGAGVHAAAGDLKGAVEVTVDDAAGEGA